MRVPLITPLASRNGTVEKDERLVNCYGEQDVVTKETRVIKRAGIDEGDAMLTGPDIYGQGIFNYDGYVFAVMNDVLGYWIYVGGSGPGGGGGGTYISFGAPNWDAGTAYVIGDKVFHNGRSYYAYAPNTGVTPASPIWEETAPGSSRYQGNIPSSGYGLGPVCASTSAAGYAAYLTGSHNSCATKYSGSGLWYEYSYSTSTNIYLQQWTDPSPFNCSGTPINSGIANLGTISQVA